MKDKSIENLDLISFKVSQFADLIEAPSSKLQFFSSEKGNIFIYLYSQVLFFYLELRTEELDFLVANIILENEKHLSKLEYTYLMNISSLRTQIRKMSISSKTLSDAEALILSLQEKTSPNSDFSVLLGELLFVIGMAYETDKLDSKSAQKYFESYSIFEKTHINKKAIKAYHNYIAALSRLEPTRNFILEYSQLSKIALKNQDIKTAGMALGNIGRDYHILGLHNKSLRYFNKALRLLDHHINSYEYQFITLNRCHLYCELNLFQLANNDFKFLTKSSFIEIKESLKALEAVITKSDNPISNDLLPATWIERLHFVTKPNVNNISFTTLEEKLIFELSKGKQRKSDLINSLYGEMIDFQSAENRLKNILNRIRKKDPNLVYFEDGYYTLASNFVNYKTLKVSS